MAFVAPENGMLVVLELTTTFDGGSLQTESTFQVLLYLFNNK